VQEASADLLASAGFGIVGSAANSQGQRLTMTTERLNTLVVDDETSFRRVLRTSLAASGFGVEEARSGEEAIAILSQCTFDLVLLDVNMPGIGGVQACREIRAHTPKVGIVMVTVQDGESEMVRALEAGADDYITKPIRFRELVARLRAVLRRLRIEHAIEPTLLRAGELELDIKRHVLYRRGEIVHLTPTEFDLLALLMRHQGAPLTHAKLLRSVWGPEYGTELDYLRSFIKTLRKKMEADPAKPKYIVTEPWVGYRFCNPLEA
jgi:two-component system, OmpR family, KDP operon response regulator KdpE